MSRIEFLEPFIERETQRAERRARFNQRVVGKAPQALRYQRSESWRNRFAYDERDDT